MKIVSGLTLGRESKVRFGFNPDVISMNFTMNRTQEEIVVLHVYHLIRLVQGLLAILGNGITIIVILKYRTLFTTTNIFILCLACSDFLAGALVCPMSFTTYVTDDGSPEWFQLCRVKETANLFVQGFTLGSTFLIALDRYIYIVHPFRYQTLLTSNRVVTMAAINIAVSFILSTGVIYAFSNNNPVFCDYKYMVPTWAVYSIIYAFFTINLVLIVCLYCYIAKIAIYHGRKIADVNHARAGSDASVRIRTRSRSRSRSRTLSINNGMSQNNVLVQTQIKVTRMILLVLGYYLGVYLPTLILDPFIADDATLGWFVVRYILLALIYSSTWVNPIIYMWKNGLFREALGKVACCHPDLPPSLCSATSSATWATPANNQPELSTASPV